MHHLTSSVLYIAHPWEFGGRSVILIATGRVNQQNSHGQGCSLSIYGNLCSFYCLPPPPLTMYPILLLQTAVSYICSNGLVQFLDILLQIPKIDVNKADNEGNTPLHFAAEAGEE